MYQDTVCNLRTYGYCFCLVAIVRILVICTLATPNIRKTFLLHKVIDYFPIFRLPFIDVLLPTTIIAAGESVGIIAADGIIPTEGIGIGFLH